MYARGEVPCLVSWFHLGVLTERSRSMETVLMCELLFSVKSITCLSVALGWSVNFAAAEFFCLQNGFNNALSLWRFLCYLISNCRLLK